MEKIETKLNNEMKVQIEEAKETLATIDQLTALDERVKNAFCKQGKRIDEVHDLIKNSKIENERLALKNKMYGKRFNFLIHGLKEKNESNA